MSGKRFKTDEQEQIKHTIEEQRMFAMTNEETLKLIERRIGRTISEPQYYRYKAEVLDDNEVRGWITTFARVGFLDHYKQRIDELLYINQKLLRKFAYETSKPIAEQSTHIIGSLSRSIRETEALLLAAGLGSPILLQVKDLIDRGLTNEFNIEHNKRYNLTDKESRETYPEDRDTSSESDDNRIA